MFWKVTEAGGKPMFGHGQYYLPVKQEDGTWLPGEWMPDVRDPLPCWRGYHVCKDSDVMEWVGAEMYEAEIGGPIAVAYGKIAVTRIRLLRRFLPWDLDRAASLVLWAKMRSRYWFSGRTEPRVLRSRWGAVRMALSEAAVNFVAENFCVVTLEDMIAHQQTEREQQYAHLCEMFGITPS